MPPQLWTWYDPQEDLLGDLFAGLILKKYELIKRITVSVDEETHRQAQIRAAELGISVSTLVEEYLRLLVSQPVDAARKNGHDLETDDSRRRRLLNEVVEEITATGGGLRMSDNLSREDLYGERFKVRDSLC